MSTPSQLSIFPSPSKQRDPNTRQPQLRDVTHRSTELHGLALHFKTVQSSPPKIQQAVERVHHIANGEERTLSQESVIQAFRQQHKEKRSSLANLKTLQEGTAQQSFGHDSRQPDKPALRSALKTRGSGLTSHSSAQSLRTSVSTTSIKHASDLVETPATEYTRCSLDRKHEAAISAHSESNRLTEQCSINRDGASPAYPERMNRAFPPRSRSIRSAKTIVSDVDSTTTTRNRSIFPQYDMTKPLSQQRYYPRTAAAPITTLVLPPVKTTPKAPVRKDSGVAISSTYECVPESDPEDVNAIWRASTRLGACEGRKVQLSLSQSSGQDRTYTIVQGPHRLFSARLDQSAAKDSTVQLVVEKIDPGDQETQSLGNITLPPSSSMRSPDATCRTPIFPHQAALDALAAASNSPRAKSISLFDPKASSRAAEALANEGCCPEARRLYTSELVLITCTRDSVGTVSATYMLEHPIAGDFPITVERSVPVSRIYTSQTSQIKVTIHHPSTTATDISEGALALASFDFARKACVLDLPSILTLEAEYMLDTVLAALFGTAAMENEHTLQHSMTFAAPPKDAVKEFKKKRGFLRRTKKTEKSQSGGIWSLKRTGVREIDEPIEEMPSLARGTLAILELGINGAFWALEKGFKTLDEKAAARQ
ncbi:hypothetical protein AMS68_000590 [Peltaster fructicola]|uniref:Uncharacterized protein n=1 Tax=Peltaster fructicola TaxID=286661 RepID=A0A6H0XK12_9PEZI|nr:hypothetical protein AMS68_000590 [Peltaster fructicola]